MRVPGLTNLSIEATIWAALQSVMDPELGASLVDLGMIRSVSVESGHATIDLALTIPECPLASLLELSLYDVACRVPGVTAVTVRRVDEPIQPVTLPWRQWLDADRQRVRAAATEEQHDD